jgi:hypothetical protein
MNTGVELLLKRMETHPEEFIVRVNHGTSQWGMLIQQFADHFDEEDHVALKAGIRKCHQEVFTGKVMQSLAGEGDEEKNYTSPYLANVTSSGEVTLGLTNIGTNSIGQATWANTTTASGTSAFLDAQRYQTDQLRIQLDAQRELYKRLEEKPKTIFEKLFNYK